MKKIVIVGAGPMGLYTAIRLKQVGFTDITLIDPRAGSYLRPGDYIDEIFETIEKNIGQPIPHSDSTQIKRMERELYRIAINEGIAIQRKKFKSFTTGGLQIEGSDEVIPCDTVLDATGAKRTVVSEVNKQTGKEIFPIKRAADNPIKDVLIAYVQMRESELKALKKIDGIECLDQFDVSALDIERLRSEFGWLGFKLPFLRVRLHKENKACFYAELPPGLDKSKHEAWFKALLDIQLKKNNVPYERIGITYKPYNLGLMSDARRKPGIFYLQETPEGLQYETKDVDGKCIKGIILWQVLPETFPKTVAEIIKCKAECLPILLHHITEKGDNIAKKAPLKKPFFLSFLIDPHRIDTPFYEGDETLPVVIPIGDAQIEGDARLAKGLMYGVRRVNELVSSVYKDEQGELNIDKEKYKAGVSFLMNKQRKELVKYYKSRRKQFFEVLVAEKEKYEKELKTQAAYLEEDKIKSGLLDIAEQLIGYSDYLLEGKNGNIQKAKKYYRAALDIYCNYHICGNTIIDLLKKLDQRLNFAFVVAFEEKDFRKMNLLIKAGADINHTNKKGYTLLNKSIGVMRTDEILKLLELGAYPNIASNTGVTPLMQAEIHNDVTLMRMLIQYGATIPEDRKQEFAAKKLTEEMAMAIEKGNLSLAKQLLEQGADPNHSIPLRNQEVPILHIAIEINDISLVRALLNKGADPNKVDKYGITPLMIAAENDDAMPIIKLLLIRGADPDKTNHGRTVLDYAQSCEEELEKLLREKKEALHRAKALLSQVGLFSKTDTNEPAIMQRETHEIVRVLNNKINNSN